MLHELGDDNYKSTFDCAIYNRVTGIAIFRHAISYLPALDLSWPEMTDIINILNRCEFAYYVEFGVICDY